MNTRRNKAFSLVSSINKTKKELNDPINIRAMENHIGYNKESPLCICDEQELRYLMQQNKQIKGMKLTKYLKSKSSKRSNSESGKIKGK
jgi:hypothetical protein